MATRVDLSDFSFFPIAELDADGRRLAVAELPKVMLFDAQTGAKIDEYPWVQGDPDSDDVPVRLGAGAAGFQGEHGLGGGWFFHSKIRNSSFGKLAGRHCGSFRVPVN